MRRAWCGLAVLLFVAGCGSSVEREPPAQLSPLPAAVPVVKQWQVSGGVTAGAGVSKLRPYIAEETVFTVDVGGTLIARRLQDGRRLWTRQLERRISAGVGGDAERLYVATHDGELLAVTRQDGKPVWNARVASEILTVPVVADGGVLVRSIDGRAVNFDATTGAQNWSFKSSVPALTLRGVGEPLVIGRAVYIGLDNGRLAALDLASGTRLWEQTIAAPSGRSEVERLVDIDSTPVGDAQALFVIGYQGRVAMLSTSSGATRWSRDMSSNRELALDDNALFVVDEEDTVWALDRRSGSALWKQEALRLRTLTGVALHGEHLAVGDFEGYVHWLRRDDGQLVARARIGDESISQTPFQHGDTLLTLSQDSVFAALRLKTKE